MIKFDSRTETKRITNWTALRDKVIVEMQQDTDQRIILKPTEPVIPALMQEFHGKVANKR